MADTRPDIDLPANTFVDLYAALNAQGGFPAVSVGTQITVKNKGGTVIDLITKATTPIAGDGSDVVQVYDSLTNDVGDTGAWGYSPIVGSKINVRVT